MVEKVAVVTGANKGIGFATVKGLCKKFNGVVYLTARNEERGLEAVKTLKELGLQPQFYLLDVSDEEGVAKFADVIKTKHGGLDILVNNAATAQWKNKYPNYEAASSNIDINFKSLLSIEKYLFPLLRNGARVVNLSSKYGLLSNLKNQRWIKALRDPNLTVEQINDFVNEYLDSLRNETFDRNNFTEGKYADFKVAKIALTALTMVQQRKYNDRNISINALHPGNVRTDMNRTAPGAVEPDKGVEIILYLLLEASPTLKGTFVCPNKTLIDWYDSENVSFSLKKKQTNHQNIFLILAAFTKH